MGRRFLIAMLAICLYFQDARAQLDSASQDILIKKLELIYGQLPATDASKVGVTLRLADLYAERARQGSIEGTADMSADRAKALRLYNEVIDKAPESARAKITLQMGHLNQLNGKDDQAIALYQKNLGPASTPLARAEAELSLGEIYFKRRDFNKAIPHYENVIAIPEAASRGLASYRRGWCNFHLGKTDLALKQLETVLRTPDLLSRNNAGSGQIDTVFQEEVARDYGTFLAKTNVTKKDVETLIELSPGASKLISGQSLAFELERLGKKDEALMTWGIVGPMLSSPPERVASQLAICKLHLDKNDKIAAAKAYEDAMQLWKELTYKDTPQEQELRRRARNFVVAWNETEKKAPSAELLSAYEYFLALFPQDLDMHMYAAQVAQVQNNYSSAWSHYSSARALMQKDKAASDKLESLLLTQIELAESAKDPVLAQEAYSLYIENSPKKTKLLEVQYQKARALYDKAEYPAAAEELRAIAIGGKENPSLRKQAADLSLDALVLMKDETRLVTWAREYEKAFVNNKSDFTQVVQKAALTKSAALAATDTVAALAALKDFDPAQATSEDKVKFYKNKLILAEKAGEIREASEAADGLLALPQASKEDRELAWGRKAYFAELRLDFSTAYAATEKIEKSLSADEKTFKLAMFAELSGRPSSPLYMNYLAQTKDMERKQLVAAELVRKSKNPAIELEKVRGVLSANPVLLGQLSAETYARTGNEALLKKALADAKVRETDGGRLLQRQAFLKEFAVMKKPLVEDKLDTSSNNKLAHSIKRRANLLSKLEDLTKRSIQSGDWTAQLVSIDLLARESERFYQDLLSAPVPPGLQADEEQQYLTLLSQQAMPYQTKASEAKAKVEQFWTADWSTPLDSSWEQRNLRKLIEVEVAALKEIAPEAQAAKLTGYKDEVNLAARPSVQEMQTARQKVFENPMDKSALEALLSLEKKSENQAMSDYLTNRLDRLNKGVL